MRPGLRNKEFTYHGLTMETKFKKDDCYFCFIVKSFCGSLVLFLHLFTRTHWQQWTPENLSKLHRSVTWLYTVASFPGLPPGLYISHSCREPGWEIKSGSGLGTGLCTLVVQILIDYSTSISHPPPQPSTLPSPSISSPTFPGSPFLPPLPSPTKTSAPRSPYTGNSQFLATTHRIAQFHDGHNRDPEVSLSPLTIVVSRWRRQTEAWRQPSVITNYSLFPLSSLSLVTQWSTQQEHSTSSISFPTLACNCYSGNLVHVYNMQTPWHRVLVSKVPSLVWCKTRSSWLALS